MIVDYPPVPFVKYHVVNVGHHTTVQWMQSHISLHFNTHNYIVQPHCALIFQHFHTHVPGWVLW